MDLPIGAVDAHEFFAGGEDLGDPRDGGTVLASDVANDVWVAADAFYFIRIAGREELDLAFMNAEPDVDLFEFSGSFVGAEPLGVTAKRALKVGRHYFRGHSCLLGGARHGSLSLKFLVEFVGVDGVLVRLPAEFVGSEMVSFAVGNGGGGVGVGGQVVEFG
jgi:hypothetical protein